MEEQDEFREYDFSNDADVDFAPEGETVEPSVLFDIDALKEDILSEIQSTHFDQEEPVITDEILSKIVSQVYESLNTDITPGVTVNLDEPITLVDAIPTIRQIDSFTFDLESILGTYQPRMELVTVLGTDGSIIHQSEQIVDGIQGIDFTYIMGALIFINVLRSFFSMFREVLKSF